MQPTMIDSGAAVSAGAALFDRLMPRWWDEDVIDLDRFTLAVNSTCILGQCREHAFRIGDDDLLEQLYQLSPMDSTLGFWTFTTNGEIGQGDEIIALEQLWRQKIKHRRDADGPVCMTCGAAGRVLDDEYHQCSLCRFYDGTTTTKSTTTTS